MGLCRAGCQGIAPRCAAGPLRGRQLCAAAHGLPGDVLTVESTRKEQLPVRSPEGVLGNCFNHQLQRQNYLHMSSLAVHARRDSSCAYYQVLTDDRQRQLYDLSLDCRAGRTVRAAAAAAAGDSAADAARRAHERRRARHTPHARQSSDGCCPLLLPFSW